MCFVYSSFVKFIWIHQYSFGMWNVFFYSRLDKYKFKTMVSHSSSDSGAKIHNFSPLPSYSVIRVNIQFKDVSIFNESFNRIHYKRHSLGPDTVSPSENLHASWVGSSEIECIMKLWDNTSNDRINIRRLQNSLNGKFEKQWIRTWFSHPHSVVILERAIVLNAISLWMMDLFLFLFLTFNVFFLANINRLNKFWKNIL